jgi:DNA invertase Pin-like site-specific DNA recombinase
MVDDMSIDTIRTLAAEAGDDDPIAALRAIEKLRRELDRVEAVAVRRARVANAPWQLIAMALGVSKQAVHKKYGRG